MFPKSKLASLLQAFDSREMNRLEDFVQSPFYNKQEKLVHFFRLLKKHHPVFPAKALTPEKIYGAVWPGTAFDIKQVRYLMSELLQLIESFLVVEEATAHPIQEANYLLRSYQTRSLDKHFNYTRKRALKLIEEHDNKSTEFYWQQFSFDAICNEFSAQSANRTAQSNLQKVTEDLDVYYLVAKLKLCCELINKQNIVAMDFSTPLLEEILVLLKDHAYANVPAVAIYHQILLTLRESHETGHYFNLKALLANHLHTFDQNELYGMYTFALNYCIKQVNTGNMAFLPELFGLYEVLLENDILLHDGALYYGDYKNIVYVGLRLDKPDWTKTFIDAYQEYIPANYRENAYQYCQAYLHFYKDEYDKAMYLLQTIEFQDIYFNLDAKSLLLKTYYELNEELSLTSLIHSFRNFLRRNKQISHYQRTIYLNLIRFVNRLIKVKNGGKGNMEAIGLDIQTTRQVADMQWLLQKVEELA